MARGEKLDRYTLIEQIAVGGMAEIWLAHLAGPEDFEKLVVIKKIKPHLALQDSFVKMFFNEAKLAAQLTHPHIVQLYELGEFEGVYFIVMEYIFGRDLSEIQPKLAEVKIPFPHEYAIKIMSQACEGLYYAHGKTDHLGNPLHIVHRDISPHNILVSFGGNVKILDFGIAKASNQYEQTQQGMLKGKVSYMSPEQILGEPLTCRSDIFSLGIVFYEMLTGLKLFSGENELAIIKSIVEGPIYPPSYFMGKNERADEIPEELERIILKALEKDPEHRYQNAWDMQFDLNKLLSKLDFNPSNIHLSNFLKQLFSKEYEREKRYLEKKIKELIYTEQPKEKRTPKRRSTSTSAKPSADKALSKRSKPREDQTQPDFVVDMDVEELTSQDQVDLMDDNADLYHKDMELSDFGDLDQDDTPYIKQHASELLEDETANLLSPKNGSDGFQEFQAVNSGQLHPSALDTLEGYNFPNNDINRDMLLTLSLHRGVYQKIKWISKQRSISIEELIHDMLTHALPFYERDLE